MSITGLDHAQVAAPPGCEPAARMFYGELLGLTEIAKPPVYEARGGVWFACGAQQLHIGVTDTFIAAEKAHPAFEVSDIDALEALAEKLVAAGAPVRFEEHEQGVRRMYTADPWGNRLELLCRCG
jgi:catechol 2,3-dioxygenase-like lactoylglutathione lyase family enzyme